MTLYCVKCGVELAEAERVCPLCDTKVYHPDLPLPSGETSYPVGSIPVYETLNRRGLMFVITIGYLILMLIPTLCDLHLNGGVSWSGYVMGGALLHYICFALPAWFRAPNPVIFVPSGFAAVIVYLLYIDLVGGGGWFLPFAFPVAGVFCLLVTTVVALCKYVKQGYLYIFGGSLIALGGIAILIEFLLYITFGIATRLPWSVYPFVVCFLVGLALIVIAICKPLRKTLRKKFFI